MLKIIFLCGYVNFSYGNIYTSSGANAFLNCKSNGPDLPSVNQSSSAETNTETNQISLIYI